MTDLNNFIYTDGVHDVLAVYVNRLLAATLRSEYKNIETLTANRTLSDADTPIQRFDGDGSSWDVMMPTPDVTENHVILVINASSGAEVLTLKNNAGTITLKALSAGDYAFLLPDGTGEYLVINVNVDLSLYLLKSGLTEWDEQSSDPSAPGANKWRLYFKAGGLYIIDDGGTVIGPLGTGGTVSDQYPMEFRMTLTTAVPVTTADVTGATTIYITPFRGNRIALYSGSSWVTRTSAQFSLALGTITSGKPYDVFVYDNTGTPTAELLAWTNDTTRATALTLQDGVLVKSGDATRRYIGSFYTTATTTTEDSESKRYLFNYYNRVERYMKCVDTTDTWAYTTATVRAANGNTTLGVGRVGVMIGYAEVLCEAQNFSTVINSSGGTWAAAGVGINSTSVDSAQIHVGSRTNNALYQAITGVYKGYLAVGYNYIQRTEIAEATGTTTWVGDQAAGTYMQTGLLATVTI